MSTLKVEIVTIDEVLIHPNASRLDLARTKGWMVVTGRDNPEVPKYKAGDIVIYIPIDSILDEKLESYLFPIGSKIKLSNHRVRSIKIRQAISQGMIIDLVGLETLYPGISNLPVGSDVTTMLNITKYEPPESSVPNTMKGAAAKRNPLFNKYTDIENFKNFPESFEEEEEVMISEKCHGSSARFCCLPTALDVWWKKILALFRLLSVNEFGIGSRNIQYQNTWNKKCFYETNIYVKIARQLNLKNILKPGEILYGEIIGSGIQGGYTYGHKDGEISFLAYDVKVNGKYLDVQDFLIWCWERKISTVPILFTGKYNKDKLDKYRTGDSTIGGQKIKEGIVIKPMKETTVYFGRKVLKYINDDYLLQKGNTDFH